jgi:hypothetical protein
MEYRLSAVRVFVTDWERDFVGPPEKEPWGGVLAHLRDPDGNILTLLGNGI